MHKFHYKAILAIAVLLPLLSGGLIQATHAYRTESNQFTRFAWDIQRIHDVHDLAEQMGDHAAIYDDSGTLHAAFGGDHLYYARCVADLCTVETVDATDYVGRYASITLDSQNHPHIAYYDLGQMDFCDDEKVKYAAWDGSQWGTQVVDEGCLGIYPSIALDALDYPHISYFDEVSDDLQLADWDGSEWHTYTPYWLPALEFSGYPSSLLADQDGDLHLAFIGGHPGEGKIWYTQKVGDIWETPVEVDTQPGALRLGMALDSDNNPHLSYQHVHFDPGLNDYVTKLRYAHSDGNSWLPPEEISDMDYLGWTSVSIGTDGYPRLAYKFFGVVAFVSKTSTGWKTPVDVPGTAGAERVYLGPVSAEVLGLTFYHAGILSNIRTDPTQTSWTNLFEIDATGWVGSHIAMTYSGEGDLHVVYTDQAETELRYAHLPAGGAWQHESILQTAEDHFIRATDIDLDNLGNPHIVYEEYYRVEQTSVLKYQAWSGNAWQDYGIVSEETHGGCGPSLELDETNIIYIAYNDCDYIHGNLVMAMYDGSWQYQTVDSDPETNSPSLFVNDVGFLYVSYMLPDYPTGTLRFAKKEGSVDWIIENVTPAVATSTSLAMDSNGNPNIAFVTESDPDYLAMHARWDGLQWIVESVTPTYYNSEARLVIDAQDRLHMAFASWANPCYAVKEGSTWAITDPVDRPPADPDLSAPETSSLAIGLSDDGLPILVYDGEMDLKAANMEELYWLFMPHALR